MIVCNPDSDPAYFEICLTLIERRVQNRRQWQQIEQELRESETKFRTLAENIPVSPIFAPTTPSTPCFMSTMP